MDSLLVYAVTAALGVAVMAGPLGCFVVWRRMAYFGDAFSHAALLGLALAMLVHLPAQVGILLIALLMVLWLTRVHAAFDLPSDTLLGIFSHSALALGMVLIALYGIRVDVNAVLFGDVLAVSQTDLLAIAGVAVVVMGGLFFSWRPLLMMSLQEDIAAVEGVRVRQVRLLLMLLIALCVAVSVQVVGMLLMTSLLIIPAAAARGLAKNPMQMMVFASGIGALSAIAGVCASFALDTPSGPSVILAAVLFFLFSRLRLKA